MIKIIPYNNTHQNGINKMMHDIALEFDENIFSKPTNVTPIIPDTYWVAIIDDEIIGTAGVLRVENNFAVLKNMMLKKERRGKAIGISKALLETVINWCENNQISKIYLGTMTQFKAAQLFYSNNGFKRISKHNLPEKFSNNPLDDVFFVKDITTFI